MKEPKEEKIVFKNSKDIKLSARLSNPSENKENLIVILCHSLGLSKDSRVTIDLYEKLKEIKISTFRFDFYGHGESDGKFEDITLSEAIDDILKAVEYLKSLGYKKIGLFGMSFGGYASLITASLSKDIIRLGLMSPVSNYLGNIILDRSNENIKNWDQIGFIYYTSTLKGKLRLNYGFYQDSKKYDGWESARNIKIPVLVVHGDNDKTVPIEQSRRLCSLLSNRRFKIIKGADHKFSNEEKYKEAIDLFVKWFKELESS
ncbi:MAG: alpha/beta fold hydrolase [archaeon]